MRNFWMNRWTVFIFLSTYFLFIFYTFVCLTLSLYALNALDFLIVMAISGRKYYTYTVYTISSIYKYAMQYSPFLSCQQCELQWISSSSRNSVCYCVYTWPSAEIFLFFFYYRITSENASSSTWPSWPTSRSREHVTSKLADKLDDDPVSLSLSLSAAHWLHALLVWRNCSCLILLLMLVDCFSYTSCAIHHKDFLHAKQCTMLSLGQLRLRSLSLSLTHSLLKCLMEFVIKQTTREQ